MADELQRRVEALEGELRRWRARARLLTVVSLAALVVAGLSLASRWLPVRTVRAQSLEVTDAHGRTRARLTTEQPGPSLTLYDDADGARARLLLSGQAASLLFVDAEGTQRMTLSSRPGLLLADSEKARVSMEVSVDGPALEVVNPAGYATLHPLDGLKLYYPNGAPAAALTPGAFSLYRAPFGGAEGGKLSVSLSAPRRPGDRARLLVYEDEEQPAFSAP